MKDLRVDRSTIPDWGKCQAIVLVYPYKVKDREHLMTFYDKFLKYIPEEIKIILLVKDSSITDEYKKNCLANGVLNTIEFVEYHDLSDIWVRDYAPLAVFEMGMLYPVKFKYDPAYIPLKLKAYVECDDKVGSQVGKRFINGGEHSLYFKWDMGNLTHNGKGTAIISNRLISDNDSVNFEHELKPMLHVFLGLSRIIFIPVEPGDETGHVDGMVRFIDEKVLVVGEYPRHSENHNFMEILAKNLKEDLGDDYTILRLMNGESEDYESEGIGSAVGNHVNFLRINDLMLFPYYGDKISKQPLQDFQSDLQKNNLNIRVIPVDLQEINKLAKKGGVLNCISWQVFSNGLPQK